MDFHDAIRSFIEKNYLLGAANSFADDASLLEHQVLDSTGVLELVAFLEQHFGVKVEDDELVPENLDSLDALHAFLMRKRAA